jgi:hypothetical protein
MEWYLHWLSYFHQERFEIKSIQDKIVEVDDADGFTHKLHHSHFKAVAT